MQVQKITLISPTTYQHTISELFAKNSVETNVEMYALHNQTNKEKILSDIYLGKMAEWAVFNYLLSKEKKCSAPDVAIYPKRWKSFDADLTINDGDKLHVKSCMAVSHYEISWVFSSKDPVTHSPSPNEFVAFVVVGSKQEFDAYFVRATELLGMYKPPMKEGLLNKKVIYESDLM